MQTVFATHKNTDNAYFVENDFGRRPPLTKIGWHTTKKKEKKK